MHTPDTLTPLRGTYPYLPIDEIGQGAAARAVAAEHAAIAREQRTGSAWRASRHWGPTPPPIDDGRPNVVFDLFPVAPPRDRRSERRSPRAALPHRPAWAAERV